MGKKRDSLRDTMRMIIDLLKETTRVDERKEFGKIMMRKEKFILLFVIKKVKD